jgi:fructosamine-3-kinase
MTDHRAISQALQKAGIASPIQSVQNLSGGCIHTVVAVTLTDKTSLVAKINDAGSLSMFEEDMHSLDAIHRTGTVATPRPIVAGLFSDRAVLLLTRLQPPPVPPEAKHWSRLGRDLAALHSAAAGSRYGFDRDNHIGSTPQPNSWCEDWVEFNAVNRLGYQIALASDNGRLESSETKVFESIVHRLDRYLPLHPRASLLHGDLWSGNVLPCTDDSGRMRIAVLDPASSIGDGWADIAMMKLFGGFSAECFDAYNELIIPAEDLDSRLAVYTLYHVLNHVNLFGRGHVGQAMLLANHLLGSRR